MSEKKSLVIVESPTKAKTINRYLGKAYRVKSSMGHLIDLPKSRLAVNVDDNFEPEYITIRGKGKILNELKKEAGKSKEVYLAADSDREGEAISYHIMSAIQKDNPGIPVKRIVFNEITESAIKQAIKNPRDVNMALVNAQKARRVLDRLVGYNLSPILWEKIKKGLSAGRVQSVALRVICEREEEIEKFVPQRYFTIEAELKNQRRSIVARLFEYEGKKIDRIDSEELADEILERVKKHEFEIVNIIEKKRKRKPQAPFTTSKLQQAAGSKLGFPSSKTMLIAQQLYEGIDIQGGPVGLITYMRTDSVRISFQAQAEAEKFVESRYGREYLPDKKPFYSNKKGAQDAHEAIRPTSVHRTPESIRQYLSRDQYRLYKLIWEQFVASQMASAVINHITLEFRSDGGLFKATGQKVEFEGFLKVMDQDEKDTTLAFHGLEIGKKLKPKKVEKLEHFTEPPPRYTDATLVKFLEESGVGRPSTYAPTISTLINRYYVVRKNKQLVPTFLGKLANELLLKYFSDLIDINFTSRMEAQLDDIAEGKLNWVELLKNFYPPFLRIVEEAKLNLQSYRGITDEETDYVCTKCGRKMLKKLGKYGYFLACSGFPECRNTSPLPLGKCPKPGCDGRIVERRTRRKRPFYGCTNYPECDFVSWDKPVEKPCPLCGSIMIEKAVDGVKSLVCLNEDCGFSEPVKQAIIHEGGSGEESTEEVILQNE